TSEAKEKECERENENEKEIKRKENENESGKERKKKMKVEKKESPTKAQECDGLKLPQGPITRSKARQMRMKLNGTVPDFISKALDACTKEKENQDSLSCFQENQGTESWSNFAVLSDFKN
ncbi:hypothetical protein Gotur_011747, partial [Gossypium turneri]